MFIHSRAVIQLLFLTLISHNVVAASVEFSATAVQQFPQGQKKIAKMNVGQDGVRREYVYNDQTIVEIYRPSKGLRYLVLPQQKTYELAEADKTSTGMNQKSPPSTNPCTGIVGEKCRLLAKEKINGRNADKWEVSRVIDGKAIKALIWVDIERGQALRQFFPDGSVVELVQMDSEKIGGRNTEKWVLHSKRPDGSSEKTLQWFDPELGIIIKEVMPGGYIRELTDIKLGKQSEQIFEIPANYKKVESAMPKQ